MSPLNRKTAALRCLAAAALLGCLQGWGASRAQASCGDYVLVDRLHSAASLKVAMERHFPRGEGDRDAASLASREEGRTPCRGPQCSRRSVPPAAPAPAAASSPVRQDWSWAPPSGLIEIACSNHAVAIEVRPRAALHRDPIFRPPRSTAPALA
jgi:hypothetical protein